MRAHIIENGVITNTVVVNNLTDIPNLVAAVGNEGIGWSYDGESFNPPPLSPLQIPQEITMRQARLVLLENGLLANVQTAIGSLPEPSKTKAQIEWDYSNALQRDNSFVAVLGAALGLTDEDVDNLFIEGATM